MGEGLGERSSTGQLLSLSFTRDRSEAFKSRACISLSVMSQNEVPMSMTMSSASGNLALGAIGRAAPGGDGDEAEISWFCWFWVCMASVGCEISCLPLGDGLWVCGLSRTEDRGVGNGVTEGCWRFMIACLAL